MSNFIIQQADGSVLLLREAQQAVLQFKPGILWYTEPNTSDWCSFMDMTYSYDQSRVFGFFPDRKPEICSDEVTAANLARWFDICRRVLPCPKITIQNHLDSHDTWWRESKSAFFRELYGRELGRVMTALAMFIEGAFLTFVGAEIGDEEFIRHLLTLRRQIPRNVDYQRAVATHPQVLPIWHGTDKNWAIPVINFSPESISCELQVNALSDLVELRDLYSGEIVTDQACMSKLPLMLKPYQIMILKSL